MKPTTPVKIYFNQPLLPVLIGLLLLLQLITPYQGWLVLLVGLGGAWFISRLWIQSLAQGLQLRRETRFGWAQVGDYLEERFSLTNRGWARGLGVEIGDRSNLPGYQAGRMTNIEGHHTLAWQSRGACIRRGLFTLGPAHLRVSDPLGLYTVTLNHPETNTLMVTPRIVPLPAIQIAPGGRAGEGRLRKRAFDPTVSAAGVREYFPGAPSQAIHWPTSARRDTLFVRFFDNTPAGDWWIFLDLEQRVQVGQDHHSTAEHGIILAASLADRGLKLGRAVGLAAYGSELAWLPPWLGDEQRWKILRQLALIAPGDLSLAELLARTRSNLGQFTSLIIITPAVAAEWLTPLLSLTRRGVVPTILLLDPLSFGAAGQPKGNSNVAPERLAQLGLAYYLITRDLLDHPEQSG